MNSIDIAIESEASSFVRFLESLTTWKKVAWVLLLSGAAVAIMQLVIVSNTDIETYLRAQAAKTAMSDAAIEQVVAKQLEQVRYAPFISMLAWPVLLSLGALTFVGVLALVEQRARSQSAAAWRAFVVAIGLAYLCYAAVASMYALATGAISAPFGLDALYSDDSAAVRSFLQTFDLANLLLAILAIGMVPRSLGIGRRTTVITVLAVLVGYAVLKGGMVMMSVPKEKPVVCELCEVAGSDYPAPSDSSAKSPTAATSR